MNLVILALLVKRMKSDLLKFAYMTEFKMTQNCREDTI